MIEGLDSVAIIRAFERLGVRISLKKEIDDESNALVGSYTFVFNTPTPARELRISISERLIHLLVHDEGGLHRNMHGFRISRGATLATFIEHTKEIPADMIAALKGAAVVDTPIDWDGYR